jgi:hypothetical protein
MRLLLLSCLIAATPIEAAADAGSVAASTVAPPAPLRPALRRVLVLQQTPAPEIASVISAELKVDGAQEVPEAAVRATLRAQAGAQAPRKQAEELRRHGLDAEQNLDLDSAIAALTQAQELLEHTGTAAVDPEALAQVRLELAQCQDEKGDLPAAQAELRQWAELGPAALDPRTYPPAFVALSRDAQSNATVQVTPLSLSAIAATGLVDEVLVVTLAGLADAGSIVLVHYLAGQTQPDRLTSIPLASSPAAQRKVAEGPVRDVLGPLGASRVGTGSLSAPAARPVVAPGADLANPLTLMAGFIFPQDDAFSKYGAGTFGLGLALAGRLGLTFGEVGLRLDIIGGSFAIAQVTPTIRWTWHKSRVTFDLEPGPFVQFRSGCTQAANACAANSNESNVLFGVEAGTGIGYQLSESWAIEVQFTLGVVLAGNFDANVPFSFQSRLAYTF